MEKKDLLFAESSNLAWKVLRLFLPKLRVNQVLEEYAFQIFAFVDGFLGGRKSKEEAAEISTQLKGDLQCSGFVGFPEKSQWHLIQKGEHLGYFVDLGSGVISVPAVRTLKLRKGIVLLLDTSATARKIVGVTGNVILMDLT